ncbi:MAG: MBL fold metallo-hydrolase [Candidatus Thorarchaeota archaeon]
MNEKVKFLYVIVFALIIGAGTFATFGFLSNAPINGNTNDATTTSTTTTTTTITTTTTTPTVTVTDPSTLDVPEPLSYNGVNLWWLVVGGFKLKFENTVIYIDPYEIADLNDSFIEPADYIIITHDHTPHFTLSDINAITDTNTTTIVSRIPSYRINEDHTVYPGDTLEFADVSFEFVASYNVNKFRDNGALFHPPSYDYVGVIVELNGTRIYHTGDSDNIPEMETINTDIVLLPVSGYAWMTPDEAADAIDAIKISSDLQYAVPMHWGHNVGVRWHAERFAELANCTVVILDRLIT